MALGRLRVATNCYPQETTAADAGKQVAWQSAKGNRSHGALLSSAPHGCTELQPKIVRSKAARRLTRAVLALGIVAWLVHNVGMDALASQLARIELAPLSLATALLALDGLAKAHNWQRLLSAAIGIHSVGYGRVLTWHFGGGFLGAVVPSSAGTDACRVLLALRGLGGHSAPCAASILTVNALGWFTGSMLGILGMLVLAQTGELPRLLRPAMLFFWRPWLDCR